MATATLIAIPVYQINSNNVINRTLYPYGNPIYFAGATLQVQTNVGDGTLNSLQAGRQAGGALIYSAIRSSVTGDAIFYSNLTPAQVATLANA